MGRIPFLSQRCWNASPPPRCARISPPSAWNASSIPAGGFIPAASRRRRYWTACGWSCPPPGAEERTGSAVESAEAKKGGFLLRTAAEAIPSRLLLVCAGGAAAPALGGGSGGYGLLSGFGHRRTPLFPSIVQVKTDPTFVRALKGVRLDGRVAFELDGRCLAAETGELLFTEYGLSGPAVMQISRVVGDWERRPKGRMEAVLDLLPDMEASRLRDTLSPRRELPGAHGGLSSPASSTSGWGRRRAAAG